MISLTKSWEHVSRLTLLAVTLSLLTGCLGSTHAPHAYTNVELPPDLPPYLHMQFLQLAKACSLPGIQDPQQVALARQQQQGTAVPAVGGSLLMPVPTEVRAALGPMHPETPAPPQSLWQRFRVFGTRTLGMSAEGEATYEQDPQARMQLGKRGWEWQSLEGLRTSR